MSGNNRTVTAGNPFLDPFRANSYDASIEWYFAPESLLSLALFYKDITSFVTNVRSDIPFTGNPLSIPDSVAIAACGTPPAGCSPAAIWAFTAPDQHGRWHRRGLRNQLPAAVHVPAGRLEQLRHHPQLHECRIRVDYLSSAG